jgi:hypothetical protein
MTIVANQKEMSLRRLLSSTHLPKLFLPWEDHHRIALGKLATRATQIGATQIGIQN